MRQHNIICLLAALNIVACNGEIYVRDGVTDGDTFFLSPQGMTSGDPVVQSWVSYSLGLSTCQLQQHTENPARASTFQCELRARRLLAETWQEKKHAVVELNDKYLDELINVHTAGFLKEYVAFYLARKHWTIPKDLELDAFDDWNTRHLPQHKAQTRLTGSWVYAASVFDTGK